MYEDLADSTRTCQEHFVELTGETGRREHQVESHRESHPIRQGTRDERS